MVLLIWDHIITIADEIQLIWPARSSFAKWAFIVNRYLVPSVLIGVAFCMILMLRFHSTNYIVNLVTSHFSTSLISDSVSTHSKSCKHNVYRISLFSQGVCIPHFYIFDISKLSIIEKMQEIFCFFVSFRDCFPRSSTNAGCEATYDPMGPRKGICLGLATERMHSVQG